MDFEYIYPVLILFGSFAVMLAIGVPITFAIGLSSLLSIITALPPDAAISVISQKMTVGLDGFTLLAIPFFVLAGNIMNTGGIARRLVNLAGNDSNLLIVFYVQIMPDDFVMQLHRF